MATRSAPQASPRRRGQRCGVPVSRGGLRRADAEALTADLDALAHPIRLQLLDVLLRHEGRVCVCDLQAAVPVKQPTVSHHLRLLREAGLVTSEKDGLWSYYRVRREALRELTARVGEGLRALG